MSVRLIARLDIKGPNVVKGVQMEGLRVVGKPEELAKRYAEDADELLYIDTVASLYGRNQLGRLLADTNAEVFVPMTVAGGISSIAEVQRLLCSGADTVAINTAALKNPRILREISDVIGVQGICVSIEAKRVRDGWEAYTDNGRNKTGKDAIDWAKEAVDLGAGQVLITSVDRDGTRKGFDVELVKRVVEAVDVPVIASGGMGGTEHFRTLLREAAPDGVAIASALHYGLNTLKELQHVAREEFDKGQLRYSNIGRSGGSEARYHSRVP